MWQKELVTKDNEVVCAYVSRMKSKLISQSSRTEQQVKNLKDQIDNVEPRFRLHGKTVPIVYPLATPLEEIPER